MEIVVITGASRGIGYAIAAEFAAAGARLLLGARNPAHLQEAAAQLTTQYPQCRVETMAADLADKAGALAFAQWCLSYGAPDIIVNNAGYFLPGSIHNEPEGQLEAMLQTNLFSAYHLTRQLLPGMMQRRSGHIFNICSIASLQAYPNGGAYSISKFALLGFSKNLREELKNTGIKVTSVMPGAVYTDSWSGSGVAPERIMEAADIGKTIYAISRLSAQAVVEEVVLRPQQGDL
jgi:short-subunit dehydrogenase